MVMRSGAWIFFAFIFTDVSGMGQTAGAFVAAPGLDLSGNWAPVVHEDQPERGPGPALVDYAGLPISDGARQWALSWDASRLTVQEHQCQVHVVSYIYRGPLQLHIWEERDPQSQRVFAIRHYIQNFEQNRTIWRMAVRIRRKARRTLGWVFHVTILTDPVYLTEPLIKSQTFNLIIPEGQNWVYPLRTRDRDPSSARHCAALLTWRESVSA